MNLKQKLRKEALARRRALSPLEHWEKSRRVIHWLLNWPPFLRAHRVLLYASFGDEVATWEGLRRALAFKKEVYLPRTHLKERALSLHLLQGFTFLFPGPYGILEPPERAPQIAPHELDLIVCPGVAFDLSGGRLGYGGGYYDRLLAKAPGVRRVALAFECQIFEKLPLEAHDICLEALITEQGLYETRKP